MIQHRKPELAVSGIPLLEASGKLLESPCLICACWQRQARQCSQAGMQTNTVSFRDEIEKTQELTSQLEAKMEQLRRELESKQHELASGVPSQYSTYNYGYQHEGDTLPPVRPPRTAERARILPPTGFT